MRQGLRTALGVAVFAAALATSWPLLLAPAFAQDGGSPGDGSGVIEWPVEGRIIDCHDVDCFQRATCNRRVLEAMGQIKTAASEVPYSRSDVTTRSQITLQVERRDRLRMFLAPECRPRGDPRDSFFDKVVSFFDNAWSRGRGGAKPGTVDKAFSKVPAFGSGILPGNDQEENQQYFKDDWRTWLKGRWEGWLSLDDGRSSPLWFRITGAESEGFVKACSDQGVVMGSVDSRGVLTLPRPARFDLGARIMVWRHPPHLDDLEGVVVVEIEPGQEISNGQVWLSRALTPEFTPDLTDYPCQTPELLDRRKDLWIPNR